MRSTTCLVALSVLVVGIAGHSSGEGRLSPPVESPPGPSLAIAAETSQPAASSGPAKVFRAGAYAVDISPEKFPVIVNAMFTERSADRVVDRLFAKAIVLDDGQTRVVLCVVDTCLMDRNLIDRAKELAAKATGIPTERMLVSATHTHSAPSAMAALGSRADARYAEWLPGRIANAIAGAAKHLAPAQVGWAVVDDWEHTFNRRWIRRPDKMLTDPFGERSVRAHMHPGYQNPDALGPSGPVDPGLSLLAVQSTDGRAIALLANYSQHYFGSPLLSSDYFGRFAQHMAGLLDPQGSSPPFVGIMSQGTSGDLMWMDYGSPPRKMDCDKYASEVAERAMNAYRRIEWHDWVPLRMAERTVTLTRRAPDEKRLAWARQVTGSLAGRLPRALSEIYAWEAIYLHEQPEVELKLQAIRIGDLGIAAFPTETFAITGLKLKLQSPLQPTFNIELANGAEGYIPPPEQHSLGGYTTWPARSAGLEVQAEPRIVEAVLGLLEEVAGRPRLALRDEHGPYAKAVLAAKPLAYWRLNDMVSPIARDATASGRDATYENGVALCLPGVGSGTGLLPNPQLTPSNFSGSQINRAAHFAGGRMRANLPLPNEAYSVELWLWNGLPHDARAVTGYVLSRGSDGDKTAAGEHLGIGGTDNGDLTGRLFVANSNKQSEVLAGRTSLTLRQWHHVVLVREGRKVTVFLDGKADITGELESTAKPGEESVFIGGRCDNFANFEGKVDEVAIYGRSLSAADVAAHFKED